MLKQLNSILTSNNESSSPTDVTPQGGGIVEGLGRVLSGGDFECSSDYEYSN
jgi:hypothetical protein